MLAKIRGKDFAEKFRVHNEVTSAVASVREQGLADDIS